jgi:hypothetical protein
MGRVRSFNRFLNRPHGQEEPVGLGWEPQEVVLEIEIPR